MSAKVQAEHGVICRLAGAEFGYFGWPSIARMPDGTLVVASSGLRTEHVCPFGKTVLNYSWDGGKSWSAPRVANDLPLDDRDAGVISLGGKKLLVTWFTSDTRRYFPNARKWLKPESLARWETELGHWDDALVNKWLGSWLRLSRDGGDTWGAPILVPVSTPHGPIRLASGDLLYLGKAGFRAGDQENKSIQACRSKDGGRTWLELGRVPVADGTSDSNYHEPHVVELPDGRLLGMIRFQFAGAEDPAKGRYINFSLFRTESTDGGQTWTQAHQITYGSPPHLLRHSSGALVCVYGYRQAPFGQRAMVSRDDGKTWTTDLVLRDDGPDGDLGYPASVELPGGDILTIYYQKFAAGEKCSLLWTRWRLPA